MRITIKDVAQRAGVSPATVSLALNDPSSAISEKTRERVMGVVSELGYRPNRLAASLARKKTNTIGLIVPDNSNFFLVAYSSCIEHVMREYGYTMILGNADDSVEKTLQYLLDFSDRGVDAIILTQSIFVNDDDTRLCMDVIKSLQIPVALVDRFPSNYVTAFAQINDFLGGYLAFKHLLELGHTRIGIIAGEMFLHCCTERLDGCKAALDEFGIIYDPALLYEGNFQIDSGIEALPYFSDKGVTAIFAFNDMIAYGVYKEARNCGIRIPDDLSVVGFDDLLFSDVIYPPLTTVIYPVKDVATAIVKKLVGLIETGLTDLSEPVTFDPALKVRSSTRQLTE